MRRLFFALWPDRAAARRLAAAGQGCLAGLDVRPVAEPDLHLTLCFLGPLDAAREACIVRQAGGISATAFELELDTLEYWSASQVLVLTASSAPAAAAKLAACLRAMAEDCGISTEHAPWRAHVTLARRLPSAVTALPGWPAAGRPRVAQRLAAQQFVLAHSESAEPRYRQLQQWALRSP